MKNLPQHVAIVMDGNGRWAKQQGLVRGEGHRAGVNVVQEIVKSCLEYKIPILSLFAFSSENWARPRDEVDFLMQLFIDALQQELDNLHSHEIKLRFIGSREQLTEKLCQRMNFAEKLTANNNKLTVNIAVNYGGQWDILNAAKEFAARVSRGDACVEELDEESFSALLSTQYLPNPDLFIRTSGELRISNFFLWQAAYTELYFCDVLWPDFTTQNFAQALASYASRNRRYGFSEVAV